MQPDIKTEFPWTTRGSTIYCNAAATGPLPLRTAGVLDEWTRLRTEPWRITLEQQFEVLATGRTLSAQLIGADVDEIALVPNTSTGINIAAQILPIAAGKIVLGYDGEFPANVYPWMAMQRRGGARLEQIALLPNGLPDWDALPARLDRGDVGLLAVSWVSFVSGDRADLMRIGAMCSERGIWLVVDAIQGVGAATLDVHACNIDVLSCGAQKWLLSPWGSGFCYVRRELVHTLEPRSIGWLATRHSHDFARMLEYDLTYMEDARKFEVATIAYQDIAGMNASIGMLHELGIDAVAMHIRALTTRLIDGIVATEDLTLLTPSAPACRAGIVAFTAADPETLCNRLNAADVVYSVRGGGIIRLAPHIYNTPEEMDRILDLPHG